jgi:hypothetical protein
MHREEKKGSGWCVRSEKGRLFFSKELGRWKRRRGDCGCVWFDGGQRTPNPGRVRKDGLHDWENDECLGVAGEMWRRCVWEIGFGMGLGKKGDTVDMSHQLSE